MAENVIFEFKTPEGHILEWEGPDTTPAEQVHRQFYQAILKQPDLSPAIAKQQGLDYKSPYYPEGSSSRESGSLAGTPKGILDRLKGLMGYGAPEPNVMTDQAAHALSGVPQAVLGIPSAIAATGSAIMDFAHNPYGGTELPELLQGMAQPAIPVVKSLVGQAPAPESPEWEQAAAGATTMLASAPVGDAINSGIVKGAAVAKKLTTRPPLSNLTDALHPNDLQFQKHAPIALSEMKGASTPVHTVEDGLAAVDERFKVNQQGAKRIVDPQSGVDASGYRQHIIQQQMDSIPDGIDPKVKTRLVAKILRETPEKITIGWLDKVRSETAATQSPFYGKDLGGQLTMDASQRAVDIARGEAVRNSLYHALDNAPGAIGGGASMRSFNQRIGALIHMKDALQHSLNDAVAQRGSPLGEFTKKARQAIGRPGRTTAEGFQLNTDEMLKAALKDWTQFPTEIPVDFKSAPPKYSAYPTGPRDVLAPAGQQGELAPSHGGELLNPNESSPYFPGTSGNWLDDVLKRQNNGEAPTAPERPVGEQLDVQKGIPPTLFGLDQSPYTAPTTTPQSSRPMSVPQPTPVLPPETNWVDDVLKANPELAERLARLKALRGQ